MITFVFLKAWTMLKNFKRQRVHDQSTTSSVGSVSVHLIGIVCGLLACAQVRLLDRWARLAFFSPFAFDHWTSDEIGFFSYSRDNFYPPRGEIQKQLRLLGGYHVVIEQLPVSNVAVTTRKVFNQSNPTTRSLTPKNSTNQIRSFFGYSNLTNGNFSTEV